MVNDGFLAGAGTTQKATLVHLVVLSDLHLQHGLGKEISQKREDDYEAPSPSNPSSGQGLTETPQNNFDGKGPLERVCSTLPLSYPRNHKTQAQKRDMVLPAVLSFETLSPEMCFPASCTGYLRRASLRTTSEEKSKIW